MWFQPANRAIQKKAIVTHGMGSVYGGFSKMMGYIPFAHY